GARFHRPHRPVADARRHVAAHGDDHADRSVDPERHLAVEVPGGEPGDRERFGGRRRDRPCGGIDDHHGDVSAAERRPDDHRSLSGYNAEPRPGRRILGMKTLLHAALLLTLATSPAWAQINAGTQKAEPENPFTMTQVATFNL